MAQQLSLEVTQQITDVANQTNTLQEQTTSLAGVTLQNRQALGLLTANQGGTCAVLNDQSGKIQNNLRNITDKTNKFCKEGTTGGFNSWDFKTNICLWLSWMTPFLDPIAASLYCCSASHVS